MSDVHVVLFMTRGLSLQEWVAGGVFERETALHLRLRQAVDQYSIVTYGGVDELELQARLPGVQILYNRWRMPSSLYSVLSPLMHRGKLRDASLFRSNQIDGAWSAIIAGFLFRRPVIVRAGYLWMEFVERLPLRAWKKKVTGWLQRFVLRQATAVVLTTAEMKQEVVSKYALPRQKIMVIPNYVDTTLFHPNAECQKIAGRVCFVGRLEPQKNLHALISALAAVPGASLICFGDGKQRNELVDLANELNVPAKFPGRISNQCLPDEINRSEVFILPSLYEGHPKALLEAMACGAAVIGTAVEGIREVIDDGVTGLLCDPSANDLAAKLKLLLQDTKLRQRLGASAATFANQEYSLNSIVEKELALMHTLLETKNGQ